MRLRDVALAWPLLLLLVGSSGAQTVEDASRNYKLRRDYASLEIIHAHLRKGMPRFVVENLLGEADYSPIEGQYYYFSTHKESIAVTSAGLVLDYRDRQGEVTNKLQTFWLGLIGE